MCGIIAVLARRPTRPAPAEHDLLEHLAAAANLLGGDDGDSAALAEAADHLERADAALRGPAGARALVGAPALAGQMAERLEVLAKEVGRIEHRLDTGAVADERELEASNEQLVRLKDVVWALRADRLRTAASVAELVGAGAGEAAIDGMWAVQIALSAIDRLEVRGRDSAGLHLLVDGHGLDLDAPEVRSLVERRASDPLFTSLAVRAPGGRLAFVYKAAAEIGELGDNTRALREAITADRLLRLALESPDAQLAVLGHTRWASVGIISEANAHPLNHEEDGRDGPYVAAALNGDVDNYLELRAAHGLKIPDEITTDAKVIPTLVSRGMEGGADAGEAFRQAVAAFDGSVAIAAMAADEPDRLLLALRGSGQALYVGLADDAYIVASEPYGVVEETSRYVRMDGETPSEAGVAGQVLVLDRSHAGAVDGIARRSYDGADIDLSDGDVSTAAITTRDIDRAGHPHYLLKEIGESPRSFQKTLRGKVVERDGLLAVALGETSLPSSIRARLADRSIRRVLVIGQGTAAVAGQAVAAAIGRALAPIGTTAEALPATELSGFRLDDDMSDALVVAISQSGTTTDTNRTVDLVRARGAAVVAIVNRRNSDLVEKSHGVLYTSDGRDVEMSVASTKAFYAQVAAGFLLATAVADAAGCAERHATHELLAALRELPTAMEAVLARRPQIAQAAARHAPSRRYWAVVGNGPNRIAAQEIRIKLSELCYKSIACDATEDKKHIDLSSEPLILVCAAGLDTATADDVAKEVAIYRAHKAAPVVITTEGRSFPAALDVIEVPEVHPDLAFVLAAVVGHLFGYDAALAIDAQALPLRQARAAIEAVVSGDAEGTDPLDAIRPLVLDPARRFFDGLRAREYDGHLEASTATRVASVLRYTTGAAPLDAYEVEHGKVGTPSVVLDDLAQALTRGIEELTRPVDAIKHQAKTVTVGISRSEEALVDVALVRAVLDAGTGRDRLSYRALRSLASLDRAVSEVLGFTRYRVDGDVGSGTATAVVVAKGGIAQAIPSRTERSPALTGTKHRAAEEREVTVGRGSDGRTFVLVPEVRDGRTIGITLLHARFAEHLPAADARAVLQGFRNRYGALRDAVTETEPVFRDERLADVPVIDLLVQPVHVLAGWWRAS